MHDKVDCAQTDGRRDVPLRARQGRYLIGRERLDERAPELPARAGDQDAARSRSDRVGDVVLQRCFTRGSSQAISCSSGSSASYSSVTW